jgi:hypothetical protein
MEVGGKDFTTRMSLGSGSDVVLVLALSFSDDSSTGLFFSGLCSTTLFRAFAATLGDMVVDLYPQGGRANSTGKVALESGLI